MIEQIKNTAMNVARVVSADFLVFQLIVLLAMLASFSVIAGGVLSAKEAFALADRQEIILVDIRSEKEWKETGIASVARPISMYGPLFLSKFQAVLKEANGRPVALICAIGGRSAWLKKELSTRGINNIEDVAEGMLGSAAGPGWLRAGLPVVPYEESSAASNPAELTLWERITGFYRPLWLKDK